MASLAYITRLSDIVTLHAGADAVSELNKQYHVVRGVVFDWGKAWLQAKAVAFLRWLRDASSRELQDANVLMHDAVFQMPGVCPHLEEACAHCKTGKNRGG
jgi:hypothetical protein